MTNLAQDGAMLFGSWLAGQFLGGLAAVTGFYFLQLIREGLDSPGRFRPGLPLVLSVLATALCFAVPIIFGHTQLAVASVTTFALMAYLMWRARK